MNSVAPTSTRALELIGDWAARQRLVLRSNADTGAGAVFSRCGRYRYLLWRRPLPGIPFMGLGMLNPSTADHEQDDRTIARATGWATRAGLSGPLVWNLFAFRSTLPSLLMLKRLPVGVNNDSAIDLALRIATHTLAAWGTNGTHRARDRAVLDRCAAVGVDLRVLRLTKHGHPSHPLYLPAALNPQPWEYSAC